MTRWKIWTGVSRCPKCRNFIVVEVAGEKICRGATKQEVEDYKAAMRASSENKSLYARTREEAP